MIRVLILVAALVAARGAELRLGKPAPVPEVEAKELLRAVCPGPIVAEKEDSDRGLWGCSACPNYVIRDWVGGWDLETVRYGHFTNATADDFAAHQK